MKRTLKITLLFCLTAAMMLLMASCDAMFGKQPDGNETTTTIQCFGF